MPPTVQVLSKAMEVFGLSCANLDGADCAETAAHPEREQAFLCNLRVRKRVTALPGRHACRLLCGPFPDRPSAPAS